MTTYSVDIREQFSALADGQLESGAVGDAMQQLAQDAGLCADWNAYHVVGEALRVGERAMPGADPAFLERLRGRLQAEPIRPVVLVEPVVAVRADAANEPTFRWKMVAGFASLAAVAALGWGVMGTMPAVNGSSGAVLASSPAAFDPGAAASVATSAGAMIRDPRLDELLAAHKESGGVSALQMPAGFLRNATFEGAQR